MKILLSDKRFVLNQSLTSIIRMARIIIREDSQETFEKAYSGDVIFLKCVSNVYCLILSHCWALQLALSVVGMRLPLSGGKPH